MPHEGHTGRYSCRNALCLKWPSRVHFTDASPDQPRTDHQLVAPADFYRRLPIPCPNPSRGFKGRILAHPLIGQLARQRKTPRLGAKQKRPADSNCPRECFCYRISVEKLREVCATGAFFRPPARAHPLAACVAASVFQPRQSPRKIHAFSGCGKYCYGVLSVKK